MRITRTDPAPESKEKPNHKPKHENFNYPPKKWKKCHNFKFVFDAILPARYGCPNKNGNRHDDFFVPYGIIKCKHYFVVSR